MRRLIVGVLVMLMSVPVLGYPKPNPVPLSWQLDFRFENIRRIDVELPGEGVQTFWYMIYTVTNNSDQDVVFHPEFTIVTDDLDVVKAGVDVPPEVYKKIRKQYENTYPWLEHPREIVGRIGQGRDNARDSVAIWCDFGALTTEFTVFVGGLSGEAVEVPNPAYDGKKGSQAQEYFVLRKTRRIRYTLPAAPAKRDEGSAKLSGHPAVDWVMR